MCMCVCVCVCVCTLVFVCHTIKYGKGVYTPCVCGYGCGWVFVCTHSFRLCVYVFTLASLVGVCSMTGFVLYRRSAIDDAYVFTTDSCVSFLFTDDEPTCASTVTYLKVSSFMYALTNITSLAVPFVLKDSLHLSPIHMGLFGALLSAPSFIKPVCTLFIPPAARSATLVGCAGTQAGMYALVGLALSHGIASTPLVCGCMFVHAFASAVGMVIRDTLTVEEAAKMDPSDAHTLFADLGLISRIGLLPVAYLSGYVLSFVAPHTVIGTAAIFPTIVAFAAVFFQPGSSPTKTVPDVHAVAMARITDTQSGLLSTVSGRGLALSLVPSYANAMFFYYTQAIGFSPEFMGRFQFFGAVAGIIGNTISRRNTCTCQFVSNCATIATIPVYFSLLLVTTHSVSSVGAFVLMRHFVLDFLASLTAVPAAVQLMQSAPKGAEGTYLALIGTISDFGGIANSLISSATMGIFGIGSNSFENISPFVALCATLSAAASPLLMFNDTPSTDEAPSTDLVELILPHKQLTTVEAASPVRDA